MNHNSYFSVENKVILVTGAGNGLGKQIATVLSKCGAIVFSGIHHIISESIHKIRLDINDKNSREKIVDIVKSQHKKLDVLINVAGTTISGYDTKSWSSTLNTNLSSLFFLCKLVKEELMEKQFAGNIINIASICGHQGFSNNPSYNVSKAGIISLTKSLANDWAKFNIRVNCISPGYFRTKMTEKSLSNTDEYNKRIERIMMGRVGEIEEIVGPVIFLASDASSYMTGSDIVIDGGFLNKGV